METIKAWREAANLSVPQAAQAVGVTRATWWRWENGVRPIGVESVERVSDKTGIAVSTLRPDLKFVSVAA